LYIIKSEVDESFYTGQCEDLSERVQHHNSGYSKSTKAKMPWQLVYYESYNTRSGAVKREVEIKKKKSRKYIEELISEFPKDKICRAVASASGGSAVADRY
jgi:putative endonuclease